MIICKWLVVLIVQRQLCNEHRLGHICLVYRPKQGQPLLTMCDLSYTLEPLPAFLANLYQGNHV